MRKLASCLVVFICCLVAFIPVSPVFAQTTPAATLALSPANGTFNAGCSFSVDILVNTGGAQTDGTDAILFYDPTRFTAKGIRSGTIYSDYPGNSIDPQRGMITITGLSSVTSAFSGAGTLATVDFTVVADAPPGTSQIKFDFDPNDKAKTTDSNVVERQTVVDVLNSVTDGTFTIGSGKCGGVGGPTGTGTSSGTVVETKTPVKTAPPTKAPLPESADFNTTMMIGIMGSVLAVLGVIGLALL